VKPTFSSSHGSSKEEKTGRTLLTCRPDLLHAVAIMLDTRRINAITVAIGCLLCAIPSGALADKLYHVDGTVIEGNVLMETEDEVKVDTKYGQLIYSKMDLTKIERAFQQEGVPTPPPAATPTPVNYATMVPAGPIDPFAPPVVPPIVEMMAKGETPPPENPGSVHTTVMVKPAASGTPREVSAPDPGSAAKSLSDELTALKAKIEAEKAGRQTPAPGPTGLPQAVPAAPIGTPPAGPPAAAPPAAFRFQPPSGVTVVQTISYSAKDPRLTERFGVQPLSMEMMILFAEKQAIVTVYGFADAQTAKAAHAKASQSPADGLSYFTAGNSVVTVKGDPLIVTAVEKQASAISTKP
jgi:hypothetical protein